MIVQCDSPIGDLWRIFIRRGRSHSRANWFDTIELNDDDDKSSAAGQPGLRNRVLDVLNQAVLDTIRICATGDDDMSSEAGNDFGLIAEFNVKRTCV